MGNKHSTLGARDFSSVVSGLLVARPTAEDVSAFGQHRKFPPHARKTSRTQGINIPSGNVEKLGINTGGNKWKLKEGQRARIRK